MEIKSNNIILLNQQIHQSKNDDSKSAPQVSFKGSFSSSFLNKTGDFMKFIEDGGFVVIFLIQDFLGMTIPRTIAGFLRDKETTGKYNIQEGTEVFGREGLTGPCMMAVAPLSLYLASKFSKSTGVNSKIISHFGDDLKNMVSQPDFDENLLKDAGKFKKEFYRRNTEKILENTLGKENVSQESVDYIMKQLEMRENIPAGEKLKKFRGKAKFRDKCMDNIIDHINNIKYEKSENLDMLRKVKLSEGNICETKNAFEGLEKYTSDAITTNKHLDKLNSLTAEKFKNASLGKRASMTVAILAATLGVLFTLPKIYARSDTAPGARKNQIYNNCENTNQTKEVAFKGKGVGKNGWNFFEEIGKRFGKNKSDFAASELEYDGHNFTHTLMAGLSLFGLLTPRGLRAYNRAEKDENGKRDLTELWEIIIRDVTSSLSVVFAVPMLTRACVTSYEKNSGFVLMNKDRTMSKAKTTLDLFNPYSKAHVMTNAELSALYDNVNSKEKMLNFCKYIDKNGGDLQKIIQKSENLNTVFNDSTLNLNSLKGKQKAEKNKEIINFVENIEKKLKVNDKKSIDEMITKLMKGAGKAGGKSKITAFARGLNSVPGLITTFFISPYILGWFIPRLTYRNTRRIHEKQDREKALQEQNRLKASA